MEHFPENDDLDFGDVLENFYHGMFGSSEDLDLSFEGFDADLDMNLDEGPLAQHPILPSVNPRPGPMPLSAAVDPARLPSPSPGLLAIPLGWFTTPASDELLSTGATNFWNGRKFDGMKVVEGLARRDPTTYKQIMEEHGVTKLEDMPVPLPPEAEPQRKSTPSAALAIEPAPEPSQKPKALALVPAEHARETVVPAQSEIPKSEPEKRQSQGQTAPKPKELPAPGAVVFITLPNGQSHRCVVIQGPNGEKKLLTTMPRMPVPASDGGRMTKSGCNVTRVTPLALQARESAAPAAAGVPAPALPVPNNAIAIPKPTLHLKPQLQPRAPAPAAAKSAAVATGIKLMEGTEAVKRKFGDGDEDDWLFTGEVKAAKKNDTEVPAQTVKTLVNEKLDVSVSIAQEKENVAQPPAEKSDQASAAFAAVAVAVADIPSLVPAEASILPTTPTLPDAAAATASALAIARATEESDRQLALKLQAEEEQVRLPTRVLRQRQRSTGMTAAGTGLNYVCKASIQDKRKFGPGASSASISAASATSASTPTQAMAANSLPEQEKESPAAAAKPPKANALIIPAPAPATPRATRSSIKIDRHFAAGIKGFKGKGKRAKRLGYKKWTHKKVKKTKTKTVHKLRRGGRLRRPSLRAVEADAADTNNVAAPLPPKKTRGSAGADEDAHDDTAAGKLQLREHPHGGACRCGECGTWVRDAIVLEQHKRDEHRHGRGHGHGHEGDGGEGGRRRRGHGHGPGPSGGTSGSRMALRSKGRGG